MSSPIYNPCAGKIVVGVHNSAGKVGVWVHISAGKVEVWAHDSGVMIGERFLTLKRLIYWSSSLFDSL